jgi:hypothetical protein
MTTGAVAGSAGMTAAAGVVGSTGTVSVVGFTSFPFEAHPKIARAISKALPDFIHFCISISNSFRYRNRKRDED